MRKLGRADSQCKGVDDGMRVVSQIVLVLVLVLVEVVGHCDSFIARNYRVPISGRRAE